MEERLPDCWELQLHNIELPKNEKEDSIENISYSAHNARVILRAEPKKDGNKNYNDKKEIKNKQKT